jgi:Flp pilus assembly protein TadG
MRRDVFGDARGSISVLTSNVPLLLGREATTNTTTPVDATAHAEINAAAITADHCAIGSNAAVAVDTTKTANYDLSGAEPVHSQCQRSAAGGDGIGSDHETSPPYHKHKENWERPAVMTKAPAARRRRDNCSLGENGVAAIEFALVLPLLVLLLMGIVQFGLVLASYVQVTNAAGVGAMTFAISRSDETPWTDTKNAIIAAAPSLTSSSLTMTFSVNGTACTSDSSCNTALTNAAPSGGALTPASVTVTYPCGSMLTGYTFWSSTCQLSSTITEGVQ